MSDIAATHRWVADATAARRAARANFGHLVRDRRLWLAMALVELVFALLLMLEFGAFDVWAHVILSLALALVPTLSLMVVVLGGLYVFLRVRLREALKPGVVLESGFGHDSVLMRTPLGETKLSRDGLVRVSARGDWVFVQHKGGSLSIWPTELFPAVEVNRLRQEIASR